jgi:hypothetical protein
LVGAIVGDVVGIEIEIEVEGFMLVLGMKVKVGWRVG